MLDTVLKTNITGSQRPQDATDTIGITRREEANSLKPDPKNGYRKTESQKRLPSK